MYTPDTDLPAIFNYFDNCPGDILEIGCNAGVTTRKLAERYPDRQIYGVDSAQSYLTMHPSQHGETPEHPGVLASGLPNVHIIEGLSPLILNSHRPQLSSVTCVFIDGDHSFAGVLADTYWLLGFLSATGNVIIWHDYYKGCPNWCRVNQVVDSVGERFNVINPPNTHLAVLCR